MIKHQHKTLARTLAYIACHAPDEFGLFWDPDGSMPWKEFYWALQEDPSLRFVREATVRELALLGIELPFILDGNRLRLTLGTPVPVYLPADKLPERYIYFIRPKNMAHIQEFGLRSISRPYITVCTEQDMSLRLAKRREPNPIKIEILGRQAQDGGIPFLKAGEKLLLVEAIPREFLILPKIREDTVPEKKKAVSSKPSPAPAGSFIVQPHHVQSVAGQKPNKGGRKDKKGWKTDSRKDRNKRDV
jgi:putative RNA 2'-phosphotransferase